MRDDIEGKKYFETILNAAEASYVDVMITIGEVYLNGEDTEKNIDEGTKWLRRAVDNGDTEALIVMGNHFAAHDKAIDLSHRHDLSRW